MRKAHSVEVVRVAERALMARLPPGTLMQRAATGLAALADRARAGGGGPAVVAVHLPSGVDADTGEVAGAAVRADVTVTFGTWKPGLLIDPGAALAGPTELIDIGLRPFLPPPSVTAYSGADVAELLPRPGRE